MSNYWALKAVRTLVCCM